MKLLFGDSHVGLIHKALADDVPTDWTFLSVGGATAAGLLNEDSETGARRRFMESWVPGDDVVVMLGECDLVDLLPTPSGSLSRCLERLHSFAAELTVAGSRVWLCSALPHTKGFSLYGTDPHQLRGSIEAWNSSLSSSIDVYGPLLGPDMFLPEELCHTPGSRDERHLNKVGYLQVWDIIRRAV